MSKYYDLSQPLWKYSPKTVTAPEFESFEIRPLVRQGILTTGVRLTLHAGTHIDSPAHLGFKMTVDEIPLETLCGTGVVLDMRREAWGVITAEDLSSASPRIEEGDRVVLNTHYHDYFDDHQKYMLTYPGLDKSAVDWLVEKRVSWVGSDTPSPEHTFCISKEKRLHRPDIWTDELMAKIDRERFIPMYGHKTLLGNNIMMIEQLGGDIDKVTGKRVTLIALPIKYKWAEASQVRVMAIL
jgi:kynurenine formamidase